jgi:hypothetical protein
VDLKNERRIEGGVGEDVGSTMSVLIPRQGTNDWRIFSIGRATQLPIPIKSNCCLS